MMQPEWGKQRCPKNLRTEIETKDFLLFFLYLLVWKAYWELQIQQVLISNNIFYILRLNLTFSFF